MKIICELTTFVLVGLFFIQFSAVDTATDEDLQMKVFDPSFRASQSAMCAMLKKANLESRGFQKEIIRKSVMKPGKVGADFETVYFYYKLVTCSNKAMQEMGQELNTSMPGVFGKEMSTRLKKEVKYRHLNSYGRCKIGLEVDFKEGVGCDMGHNKLKLDDGTGNEEKEIRREVSNVRVNFNVRIRVRVRVRVRVGWKRR